MPFGHSRNLLIISVIWYVTLVSVNCSVPPVLPPEDTDADEESDSLLFDDHSDAGPADETPVDGLFEDEDDFQDALEGSELDESPEDNEVGHSDKFPELEDLIIRVRDKFENSDKFKKLKLKVEDVIHEITQLYHKLRDSDKVHVAWRMRTWNGIDEEEAELDIQEADDDLDSKILEAVKDKLRERDAAGRRTTMMYPTAPKSYIVTGSFGGNSSFLADDKESIVSRYVVKKN